METSWLQMEEARDNGQKVKVLGVLVREGRRRRFSAGTGAVGAGSCGILPSQ